MRVLRRIADIRDPDSLASRLRRRRLRLFIELIRDLSAPVRILDVGGTQRFWEAAGLAGSDRHHITLLNLSGEPIRHSNMESRVGDARSMPEIQPDAFDVVFSNSVIEHLGSFDDQNRMAKEVRRLGRTYFVQTPNRYFPVEPHFLFPGFQFLPVGARAALVQRFRLGWYDRIPDRAAATRAVQEILLIGERELRRLFPEANIAKERFLGLTKSLIAYRKGG